MVRMIARLRNSLITALLLGVGTYAFTIGVLAPVLPRVVGAPDLFERRSLDLPAAAQLHISNQNGEVRVYTQDAGNIQVDASVSVYLDSRQSEEQIREALGSLVEAQSENGSATVVTHGLSDPAVLDLRVDYVVTVPQGTAVSVETQNGNVTLAEGCGAVTVKGGNCDIEIDRPGGAVVADTANGRIRVLDAPQGAQLTTINGNVYAHLLGGALSAETANGTIVARLLRPDVSACRLNARNGGIVVVMAPTLGGIVRAQTARGSIRCDVPLAREGSQDSRHVLEGRIGSGDSTIDLDTLNGNIVLTKGTGL